ncbi:hypothetical protein FJY94_03700 [Candidatus Kaiserbacteria bacterium]|nr:hypothetical protein [Candidatus Kaiserbacteria bacterium]
MGKAKSNGGKASLVQTGTIVFGDVTSAEDAELDAQTRPGVVRYEMNRNDGYIALYGHMAPTPAPAPDNKKSARQRPAAA